MNISVDGAFIYFTIPIFGGIPITQTTVSFLIVTVILCWACIALGKGLKKRPDGKQVMVEKGVMMLQNMVVETMGAHNVHWTPFIGTIFLSSICGTLIGLTGFFRSATADISCVMVWALMVTAIIWFNNIKHKGFFGWLKGFTEPIKVMTPMNVVSEIAQPLSMTFRHFGNVAGGGVITSIIYAALTAASTAILKLIATQGWLVAIAFLAAGAGFVFLWKKTHRKRWIVLAFLTLLIGVFGTLRLIGLFEDIPFLCYGIPAVLSLYFDLFSGFVQAYVFCLLTMVYIGGSLPEPQEDQENSK